MLTGLSAIICHNSIRFVEDSNTEDILWFYLVTKCNRNPKFCALLKKIHILVLQMKVNLTSFKLSLKVEIFFEDCGVHKYHFAHTPKRLVVNPILREEGSLTEVYCWIRIQN